jgi:hypothetical protein
MVCLFIIFEYIKTDKVLDLAASRLHCWLRNLSRVPLTSAVGFDWFPLRDVIIILTVTGSSDNFQLGIVCVNLGLLSAAASHSVFAAAAAAAEDNGAAMTFHA